MSEDFKLTIGNKIRISRRQMGLSQREFAEQVQVSDKAISSYEVGSAFPGLEVMRNISLVTNKPLAYFVDQKDTTILQIQMRLKRIEDEFKAVRKLLDKEATLIEEKKLLQ